MTANTLGATRRGSNLTLGKSILDIAHRALPATLAALAAAAVVAPLANWQFGTSGIVTVAASTAAVVLSLWLAVAAETALSVRGQIIGATLAAMGLRMIAPLMFALAAVTWGQAYFPKSALLYLVPMYLAMLITDTVVALRRSNRANRNSNSAGTPITPTTRSEVK